ncbi:hypothetical protein WA158_002674 [Blastocystis sp. Blastoise]
MSKVGSRNRTKQSSKLSDHKGYENESLPTTQSYHSKYRSPRRYNDSSIHDSRSTLRNKAVDLTGIEGDWRKQSISNRDDHVNPSNSFSMMSNYIPYYGYPIYEFVIDLSHDDDDDDEMTDTPEEPNTIKFLGQPNTDMNTELFTEPSPITPLSDTVTPDPLVNQTVQDLMNPLNDTDLSDTSATNHIVDVNSLYYFYNYEFWTQENENQLDIRLEETYKNTEDMYKNHHKCLMAKYDQILEQLYS